MRRYLQLCCALLLAFGLPDTRNADAQFPNSPPAAPPAGFSPPAFGSGFPASAPGSPQNVPAGVPTGFPPVNAGPVSTATVASADIFLPDAARLLALQKMSEPQIKEFINDLMENLELTGGYTRAGEDAPKLPVPSDKIILGATVIRKSADKTDLIRFGYVIQQRLLPQLWIYGITVSPSGVSVNPDATPAQLDPKMAAILGESNKIRSKLSLDTLKSRIINLSYIDADGALFGLRAMGFSAITDSDALASDDSYRGGDVPMLSAQPAGVGGFAAPGMPGGFGAPSAPGGFGSSGMSGGFGPQSGGYGSSAGAEAKTRQFPAIKNMPSSISFDRLPLIIKMPLPEPQNTGLVGATLSGDGSGASGGSMSGGENRLGSSVMPSAASALASTVSAGTYQLLVLYHPDYPDQLIRIQQAIQDVIDRPARQVAVEGLVMEISKTAFNELGVQWQRQTNSNSITLGTPVFTTPGNGSTLLFNRNTIAANPTAFMAQLNALVESNKAEILSRPSVLTLDNRQASIRVGTDIPIPTSRATGTGTATSISFNYLATGIILNVRPRISEDGREISMLIDATVSSQLAGSDVVVLDSTKNELARAPTINTRRVQTYARINNNTPLIIGGLLSKNKTTQENKLPLLGDIPLLGKLFGFSSHQDDSDEVIIVLTPSVVTEEFRATKAQFPRDDDRFDLLDTTLLRSTYRVRAEDLVDSQYIRFNQRFLDYRSIANKVMSRAPELLRDPTFSQFEGSHVPGEFIFVSGEMYRMLARLKTGTNVNIDKLTYFEGVNGPNFQTATIGGLLRRYGNGKDPKSFFEKNPGKALTLRFTFARRSKEPGEWATEPLAEVKLVDCPDRDHWKKLVWELNQPVEGEQKYYTIVINDESDLDRLKLAIALKNTILANGNEQGIVFDNFLPGRMLSLQEIDPNWERTLEATIARYFYFGEFYYPAFTNRLEKAIQDLDQKLRRPEFAKYLDNIRLP